MGQLDMRSRLTLCIESSVFANLHKASCRKSGPKLILEDYDEEDDSSKDDSSKDSSNNALGRQVFQFVVKHIDEKLANDDDVNSDLDREVERRNTAKMVNDMEVTKALLCELSAYEAQ